MLIPFWLQKNTKKFKKARKFIKKRGIEMIKIIKRRKTRDER